MLTRLTTIIIMLTALCACSAGKAGEKSAAADTPERETLPFDSDSAYAYLAKQVEFGPRVPGTPAHTATGDWLLSELHRHGAIAEELPFEAVTFDGKRLKARNIRGRFNPNGKNRLLLIAHYDCRPWADEDEDPQKRPQPVDGANDGASGVAVLLETARAIGEANSKYSVDILFVDAEDWGTSGDEKSWALGAREYALNTLSNEDERLIPKAVVVLDMVGGKEAVFPVEYFSQQNAPALVSAWHDAATESGYAHLFPRMMGGAVTDDHVEFINVGIPSIDIIEYHPESGFNPTWHTADDNLENISKETLGAVGATLASFLREQASPTP